MNLLVFGHLQKYGFRNLLRKSLYLRFSISSSGGHFLHRSHTVLAILVQGHQSDIPMKF